jgi:hypothetical protein
MIKFKSIRALKKTLFLKRFAQFQSQNLLKFSLLNSF